MITEAKVVEGLDRKLKKLRDGRGLSQQELADRLETARSVISTYETGVSMPTYGKLIKLSRIFDVSTDYLLGVDTPDEGNGGQLQYLQRGLGKLNPEQLDRAEKVLKAVFDDIFEDDEDDDDGV